MSRTVEQIRAEIIPALLGAIPDVIESLAAELDDLATASASALAGRARGNLLNRQHRYAEALVTLQRAEELARSFEPSPDLAHILSSQAVAHVRSGDPERALALNHVALDDAIRINDRAAQVTVLLNLGLVFEFREDHRQKLEVYQRAFAIAIDLGDEERIARCEVSIAMTMSSLGRIDEALSYARRAQERFMTLGSYSEVARSLYTMASAYQKINDPVAALDHAYRGLEALAYQNDEQVRAHLLQIVALVSVNMKDYSSAIRTLQQVLVSAEKITAYQLITYTLSNLGELYQRVGDHGKALEYYHRAENMGRTHGFPSVTAMCLSNQATWHVRNHDYARAQECIAAALAIESINFNDDPILAVRLTQAEIMLQHDTLDEAEAVLDEVEGSLGDAVDLRLSAWRLRREIAHRRNDLQLYVYWNTKLQEAEQQQNDPDVQRQISALFNVQATAEERRQLQRHRELLYATLPKDIAERMVRGEVVTTDKFPQAAVLFADIVGFTPRSADLDPDAVVALLSDIFNHFDTLCASCGVTKLKTMGDSYISFKGDGSAEENATAIAELALNMQQATFHWPDGPVEFRIGIHIGPVTAGVIGTERLQYDIWGDTVNVASRMESSGEPGRVHVSEQFASFLAAPLATLGASARNDRSTPKEGGEGPVIPRAKPEEQGTWHMALRGETDLKGKGLMTTYWLERRLS